MKYAFAVVVLFTALQAGPVFAQGPTPTPSPTLRPISPTPTSEYLYLRPTPTLFPFADATPIPVSFDAQPTEVADMSINMYRYWNKDHILDLIGFGGLFLFAVQMLVRMIGRGTHTNN